MNTHDKYVLPPLPESWEIELLDWVSACQSAYHIDNTPGHRFGGLGSNLEENRSEIICFVRGLIESHAYAAIEADRQTRGEYVLAKHQPCGCVICTCEDNGQCQGCGARHCGTHPIAKFSNPVYETPSDGQG